MNILHVAVFGFLATLLLTTLLGGSQGLGITRMNLPYILGTMFTPDRDKAKVIGAGVHFLNGWIFCFFYAMTFEALGRASIGLGLIGGTLHAAFVLTVLLPLLPGAHPRMASEQHGPTVTKRLEPPGFLGLHYGPRTPLSIWIAHLVYGGLLGAFYQPVG